MHRESESLEDIVFPLSQKTMFMIQIHQICAPIVDSKTAATAADKPTTLKEIMVSLNGCQRAHIVGTLSEDRCINQARFVGQEG